MRHMSRENGHLVQHVGGHRLQSRHLRSQAHPIQHEPGGDKPSPSHKQFCSPQHFQRYISIWYSQFPCSHINFTTPYTLQPPFDIHTLMVVYCCRYCHVAKTNPKPRGAHQHSCHRFCGQAQGVRGRVPLRQRTDFCSGLFRRPGGWAHSEKKKIRRPR